MIKSPQWKRHCGPFRKRRTDLCQSIPENAFDLEFAHAISASFAKFDRLLHLSPESHDTLQEQLNQLEVPAISVEFSQRFLWPSPWGPFHAGIDDPSQIRFTLEAPRKILGHPELVIHPNVARPQAAALFAIRDTFRISYRLEYQNCVASQTMRNGEAERRITDIQLSEESERVLGFASEIQFGNAAQLQLANVFTGAFDSYVFSGEGDLDLRGTVADIQASNLPEEFDFAFQHGRHSRSDLIALLNNYARHYGPINFGGNPAFEGDIEHIVEAMRRPVPTRISITPFGSRGETDLGY